jgi:hypothetical protein
MPNEDRWLRIGHLLGAGFDLRESTFTESEEPFRRRLENVLALRRELAPWIVGAEPYRWVRTEAGGLRVFGLHRRESDGSESLLVNGAWLPEDASMPAPAEWVVEVAADRPMNEAVYYGEALTRTSIRPTGQEGTLRFSLPGADLFSLLLQWSSREQAS